MLSASQPPIAFDSEAGRRLFFEAEASDSFWPLMRYFETQNTGSYCGVASTIMVLNALEVPAPSVERLGSSRFWMQEHFFTDAVKEIVSPESVAERGIRFEELAAVLETFGLDVQRYAGDTIDAAQLRTLAEEVLHRRDALLLVNYDRAALGQRRGGHWSPLGAYNAEEDRALILDVSRFSYPPVWVTIEDLLVAMDGSSDGRPRGLLIVFRQQQEASA